MSTYTKARFDSLDVTAMVACLQRNLAGRRVVNIYDGMNGETYIFKLDHGGGGGDGDDNNKNFLLLESGVRFHTLSNFQAQASGSMPSPFAAKLRKHVRGLRLETVKQIGNADRVVLLQFGAGPSRHSVVLELYARGNLVLCDRDFVVLALLRSHVYHASTDNTTANTNTKTITDGGEEKKQDNNFNNSKANNAKSENNNNTAVAVQVGQVFPVSYAASIEKKKDGGSTDDEEQQTTTAALLWSTATAFNAWALPHIRRAAAAMSQQKGGGGSKKKKQKSSSCTPKTLLLQNQEAGVSQFGPGLIEHCLRVAGCDPHANLVQRWKDLEGGGGGGGGKEKQQQDGDDNDDDDTIPVAIWSDQEWARLKNALQNEGPRILESLRQTQETKPGYILFKPKEEGAGGTTTPDAADSLKHADKLLLEFQPVLLKQHENRPHLACDNFASAVEDFFDHLQHQKVMLKAAAAERAAQARLEKVRADQRERLDGLRAQQDQLQREANVVQLHADSVDKALAVINSALDSGMDWDQLEQVVEVERTQNKNPIALLIHRLDLEHDAMVLRLPVGTTDLAATNLDHDEPTVDVRISLKESAYSNANSLFAKFRSSKEKSQKTMEASTKALKAAEETALKQLAEAQKRSQQQSAAAAGGKRRALWFEKFHWFVTSDNYLVIAGRDAHQNELLVKRYLRPGDAYLHADVHGAASCILRAKRRRRRQKGDGGTTTAATTEVVPLSEQALREAGHFTICRSAAWTSRMVTSAWWVESHQVSKTAPTGEYLTVGSFMIRGKKNFLPPSPLEMGLGVLFLLGDEESLLRHKNERRDFALMGVSDDEDEPDEQPKKGQGKLASENIRTQKETRKKGAGEPELPKAAPEEDTDTKPLSNGNSTKQSVIVSDDADNDFDEGGDGKETAETATVQDGDAKPKQKKKGLSARERRLIKKYGSLEAAEKAQAAREEDGPTSDAEPAKSNNSAPVEQKPAKRGKKAKQKKMMKKYADQDDEDRELAMLALQGGEKIKNKKKTPGSKRDPKVSEKQQEVAAETVALLVKDASSVADRLPDEVRSLLAECVTVRSTKGDKEEVAVRWDKFDAETIEQLLSLEAAEAQVAAAKRLLELKTTTRVDNFSASLGGIIRTIRKHGYKKLGQIDKDTIVDRKQSEEKDKEYTKGKQSLDAEGAIDDDLDDDAVDDTTELSKLTGKPQAEDMLLSAVPICAPYQTLSQYAYRIKLTPGNMKRGKASKQCVDMFLKTTARKGSEGADRQLDLIKRVGDNDWVQVICGDVKLAAAGASKAVKQNKAKAKAKNKQKSKGGK